MPLLSALAAFASLTGTSHAQFAWVDPVNGTSGGQVDDVNQPFLTIGGAISATSQLAGASNPYTVICKPGIYSGPTNGEGFPVIMKDFVNVRGAGARKCTIRALASAAAPFFPFYPTPPFGARVNKIILVDFSFTTDTNFTEALDGFTLQGGNVQVYVDTEESEKKLRVSNCLFDMVNFQGPDFGVLGVQTYNASTSAFPDLQVHLLNNTFIQGWRDAESEVDLTGVWDSVAICNTTEAPNGGTPLIGAAHWNVQNNLIRCIDSARRTPLLGIDGNDTTCLIGSSPGPTNAFDVSLVGGVSVGGSYRSLISGGQPSPTPKVNIVSAAGGTDPNFFGEQNQALRQTSYSSSWDARLFPTATTNPLQDQGSSPVGAILSSVAGLAHSETSTTPAFAFDCDGHGNRRLKGEVDIGFYEIDTLGITGNYANFTISHNTNPTYLPISYGTGSRVRYMAFTEMDPTAQFWLDITFAPAVVGVTAGGYAAPVTIPGVAVPGLSAPDDMLYMDNTDPSFASAAISPKKMIPTTFANTFDGTSYSFNSFAYDPGPEGTAGAWLNEQVVYFVPATGAIRVTNLQSEIF